MSRTTAINSKCKDCIYDPKAPKTWREQVQDCRSEKSCALWPYRPVSIAAINQNRKDKQTDGIDIDALVAGLDDEDEVDAATEVKVVA